jgi:hypothetical protein
MALGLGYLFLVALDLLATGEQYDHGVPVAEGLLVLAGGLALFTAGGVHLHERRRHGRGR